MSNKLTAFYDNLIKLCGLTLGDHGRLGVDTLGSITYLRYDEKFVIFPEKQYLNAAENEEAIILHPLSESVIRGTSEVQDLLRRAAIFHLNMLGRIILDKAIQLNYDISCDKSFKPNHKLSELFANIGDIDETFFKYWEKLNQEMQSNSKARLFDIYLKSHGEVGGKKYDRICSIASPLYDEIILNTNKKIFDVEAPRKKDINILKSIILALFPLLETGGYVVGSSDSVAPYLNAFIDALILIETRFNDIVLVFGKDANNFEGAWCSGIDIKRDVDLSKIRNLLPADKPYNIGVPKDRENELAESKPNSRKREPVTQREPNALVSNLTAESRTSRDEPKREETEPTSSDDTTPFWMRETRGDRASSNSRDDRNDRTTRRDRDYDDRYSSNNRYGRNDERRGGDYRRRNDDYRRESSRYDRDYDNGRRSSSRRESRDDVPYWMNR